MKAANLIPAALLMIALGAGTLVYAETGADDQAPPPPPKEMPGHGMKDWQPHNELLELLPDDKRKILKYTMDKTREENKGLWEHLHKLHEERDALLKAPKFDQDAFLKKSDEIDAIHEKMQVSHEKAIASVAAQFTPEERRVLLVMGHMMHHHHGHKGGAWGHGKGPGGPGGPEDMHQPS